MRQKMLVLSVGLSLIAFSLLLLGFVIMPANSARDTAQRGAFMCGTHLTAGIYHGPDSPTDLSGNLTLYVKPDETFTGTLVLNKGGVVGVRGQGVGRGMDMVFTPPSGKQLFAHGSMEYSLAECKGLSGGTLTGPQERDLGDWSNYPPYIRIISGTISLADDAPLG